VMEQYKFVYRRSIPAFLGNIVSYFTVTSYFFPFIAV
jgi:hypothetical protein